jgi:sugar lactone lactonase YvrE
VVLVVSLVPVASTVPGLGSPSPSPGALRPDLASLPNPFVTGMAATIVLGGPGVASTYTGTNASSFGGEPEFATFDAHGDLWVIDKNSNRVLEFRPPLTTGKAAYLVLGQGTFRGDLPGTSAVNLSAPGGIAFDRSGDLWVADSDNDRVLEFRPPFASGMAASLVLGQSSLSTTGCAQNQTGLCGPRGISFDAQGDLWVADTMYNRVLEYVPPFTSDAPASLVLGQTTFTGNGGGLSATALNTPRDALVADGFVWVADEMNNRVVGYPAPYSTGEAATIALGQNNLMNSGSTGEGSMDEPNAVTLDPQGNLWVSDSDHNRVVEFEPPFTTFENPTVALGQPTLSSSTAAAGASGLDYPVGVTFAPNGTAWVSDTLNKRVLAYVPAEFDVTLTPVGIAAGGSWAAHIGPAALAGTGALSEELPNGTWSFSVEAPPGYVANLTFASFNLNGEPLSFSIAFEGTGPHPYGSGMPATVVLGQPNFQSSFAAGSAGVNAVNLGGDPYAEAFNTAGDLWVADATGNRVLEYVPTFTNGMRASLVLGQSSFSGGQPGTTPHNLSFPDGLAFDASGDLWVADSGNNRVLEFVPPFYTGMSANLVLGQSTFYTGGPGHGPTTLFGPSGIDFDAHGDLWVSDSENNRVVVYAPPLSDDESAGAVLGQSLTTGDKPGLTAVNESHPSAVAFDSAGDAWVADTGNNRVVEYPAPFLTGEAASVVLGQANATSNSSGGPSSLAGPEGIADVGGNLWVTDTGNDRTVEFPGPTFTTFEAPTVALGQGNATDLGGPATGPCGLSHPSSVAADGPEHLWVGDAGNDRVLGYVPASFLVNFTETGLSPGTPWSFIVNGTLYSSATASRLIAFVNGTYDWSVPPISGYQLTSSTPTVVVNGAPLGVALNFSQSAYSVTFAESDLPSGTNWTVEVGGHGVSGTGTALGLELPNGTYDFTVPGVPGYQPTPRGGSIAVNAGPAIATVSFAPTTYALTFSETGLPSNSTWAVRVNGLLYSSLNSSILVPEANGSYTYRVGAVPGYTASPVSGNGSISAAPSSVAIQFTPPTAVPPPSPTTHSTPTNASSNGLGLLTYALIAAVVALAALAAVLALRGRRPPPTAESTATPAAGPTGSTPGPGGVPPAPDWKET